MRTVFEAWEQFAYGNVCTRDSKKNSFLSQLRKIRSKSMVKQTIKVVAVSGALAVGSLTIAGAASATLPQVRNQKLLKQLKVGPPLGAKLHELREYLKMTREEAASLLNVSESSLQKLEEGEVDMPNVESFRNHIRFLELADYLQKVTGDRRFVMVSLFRSKLPAFGDKTAIELARSANESSLAYISATFRRMYG